MEIIDGPVIIDGSKMLLIIFPFILGLITKPKNQMSCGSCAAFAATATHETCMRRAGTPLKGLDLSEQQLVDRGYNGKDMNGCNGAYVGAYQVLPIAERLFPMKPNIHTLTETPT